MVALYIRLFNGLDRNRLKVRAASCHTNRIVIITFVTTDKWCDVLCGNQFNLMTYGLETPAQ